MARGAQRPSAALVLGVLAGLLAALTFLPTAIPLTWMMLRAEEAVGLRQITAVATSLLWTVRQGADIEEALKQGPQPAFVLVRWPDGTSTRHGSTQLPPEVYEPICGQAEPSTLVPYGTDNRLWAISCLRERELQVVAASPLDIRSPVVRILATVGFLAAVVGIITALGVLRLLNPLSQITRALDRVGSGERGVRMPQTGLAELDDLVDRLNAAARSMEDREDAILGRIEVVQEMARIVAHEIRNPLQSLELLTSLVASEEDDTERQEIARSIHAEIRTLEQVVHRLLRESAARGSLRLRRSEQPIAPLIEQVIAICRPEANANGLRLQVGPLSLRPVSFDPALLKRSIENLVLNALQAVTPGSGVVSIAAVEEVEYLLVSVDDNGPGVDPTMAQQIFDPNVTTKRGGTGLGLALVKGVTDAHNGYIRYGSSELGGARFEMRIPLSPPGEEDRGDRPEDPGGRRQPLERRRAGEDPA